MGGGDVSDQYQVLFGEPRTTYTTSDGVPYRTDRHGTVFVRVEDADALMTRHALEDTGITAGTQEMLAFERAQAHRE